LYKTKREAIKAHHIYVNHPSDQNIARYKTARSANYLTNPKIKIQPAIKLFVGHIIEQFVLQKGRAEKFLSLVMRSRKMLFYSKK
jgi:hypothetical protein